jgi:hypothetical protein
MARRIEKVRAAETKKTQEEPSETTQELGGLTLRQETQPNGDNQQGHELPRSSSHLGLVARMLRERRSNP